MSLEFAPRLSRFRFSVVGTRERGSLGLARFVQFICRRKKHFDSVHTFAPTMFLVSYPHSTIPLEVRLSMLTGGNRPKLFLVCHQIIDVLRHHGTAGAEPLIRGDDHDPV